MAGSKFSSALKLTDLDDFISPSQECVKPVPSARPARPAGGKGGGGGSVTIRLDDGGGAPVELTADGEVTLLKKAQVTLNDCLACSGCITSAESVLIGQQSVDEVYRALALVRSAKADRSAGAPAEPGRPLAIVVSVSPQSRASLAAHCALTAPEAAAKLAAFFGRLGADRVLDTTVARDVSLIEACNEFVRRKRDSDATALAAGGGAGHRTAAGGHLPMLASACPGWVCYAEKTHGAYVLPYISTVKSPQQIMGSLVKDLVAGQLGLPSPAGVYHVAVMPCYDKKLEASRPDFYDAASGARDVDCVITTGEVVQMVLAEGFASLADVPLSPLPSASCTGCVQEEPAARDLVELTSLFVDEDGGGRASALEPYVHAGGGSGGYLEHVFKHAASALYGVTVPSLNYQVKRNQDFQEVTLSVGGEVKLTFALAYGFRNIQNIVQKVKQGRCPYDFVEVMACPAGCLNGGGQLRSSDAVNDSTSARELLQRVTRLYNELPIVDPWSNSVTKRLYKDWLGGEASDKARQLLHTQYHAVEKTINALTLKW